jgi:hypothetical protein
MNERYEELPPYIQPDVDRPQALLTEEKLLGICAFIGLIGIVSDSEPIIISSLGMVGFIGSVAMIRLCKEMKNEQ